MVDLRLIKHASAGMDAGCMLQDHVLGSKYAVQRRHCSHESVSLAYISQRTRNSMLLRRFELPRWAGMLATMHSSRSRLPRSLILLGELIKGVTRSEWKTWVLLSVVCSQMI